MKKRLEIEHILLSLVFTLFPRISIFPNPVKEYCKIGVSSSNKDLYTIKIADSADKL